MEAERGDPLRFEDRGDGQAQQPRASRASERIGERVGRIEIRARLVGDVAANALRAQDRDLAHQPFGGARNQRAQESRQGVGVA